MTLPSRQSHSVLPILTSVEPLPERLVTLLQGKVTLIEPGAESFGQSIDFLLLPATVPLKTVVLGRERPGLRYVIGFTGQQPSMEQRLRWIRAGGDDLCAVHEVPRCLERLWSQVQVDGARKIDHFLVGLGAYLEKRSVVAGEWLGRYVELVRQREGVLIQPTTQEALFDRQSRWPVELMGQAIRGTMVRFGTDTLEVAFPVRLKVKDSLRFLVRGAEYRGRVEGEVLRLEGTAQGWWVVTVLVKGILLELPDGSG